MFGHWTTHIHGSVAQILTSTRAYGSMMRHKFCSNIVSYNVPKWALTITSFSNSFVYSLRASWKSANDRLCDAWATDFIASISRPEYVIACNFNINRLVSIFYLLRWKSNSVNIAYQFTADDLIDIVGQAQHDFAKQHVFQCSQCFDWVDTVVSFKCFVEVRVGSFEVTLISCMQDARLQVQCTLHFWGTVDCIGGGAGWGESGTSLWTNNRRQFE